MDIEIIAIIFLVKTKIKEWLVDQPYAYAYNLHNPAEKQTANQKNQITYKVANSLENL